MSVIWPGLEFIIEADVSRRGKKTFGYAYPFRLYQPPQGFNRGVYSAAMMDQISALRNALQPKSAGGGRVQMNATQVRAAIFSICVNLDMGRRRKHDGRRWEPEVKVRWGIDEHTLRELRAKSQRVIRTLERHLKRANRRLRAAVTHNEYEALLKAWRMHLRWMRLHLVYFRPLPPVVKGRKRRQQLILDNLMVMAEQGLRHMGFQAPDAKDLRKICAS
jgi:hypothetical protein